MTEFIDRSRSSTCQGYAYDGADVTLIVELPNHVPQEFGAWVDTEVAALVGKGCIARRSEVAGVFTHPKLKVTLPVEIEPTKPRFICNARNLPEADVRTHRVQDGRSRKGRAVFMVRSPPNSHGPQVRASQRASTPRFMDVFRDVLKGSVLRVDRLVFGWCESPYIYHMPNSAVAQYLRHLDVPITTWLDDFWKSNFRTTKTHSPAQQREAAREVASPALNVFYQCGYFMSIAKCVLEPTTRLVFLVLFTIQRSVVSKFRKTSCSS